MVTDKEKERARQERIDKAVFGFISALAAMHDWRERQDAVLLLNSEMCLSCGELDPRCVCTRDD